MSKRLEENKNQTLAIKFNETTTHYISKDPLDTCPLVKEMFSHFYKDSKARNTEIQSAPIQMQLFEKVLLPPQKISSRIRQDAPQIGISNIDINEDNLIEENPKHDLSNMDLETNGIGDFLRPLMCGCFCEELDTLKHQKADELIKSIIAIDNQYTISKITRKEINPSPKEIEPPQIIDSNK